MKFTALGASNAITKVVRWRTEESEMWSMCVLT